MANQVNIFWFRRDLRLHDNTGLHHALKAGKPVIPIFIFDRDILDKLENIEDRRVEFIHQQVEQIQKQLISLNSSLDVFYGRPMEVFEILLKKYDIDGVFVNDDYEPYARQRDLMISKFLKVSGKSYYSFKDHVIFEKEEVMKDDGSPYTIFTPYSKKWKIRLEDNPLSLYPIEPFSHFFFAQKPIRIPALSEIGFKASGLPFPDSVVSKEIIKQYAEQRNFPGKNSTSKLGVHLRFGTISIRELAGKAIDTSEVFLNELIWRDFYQMILWNFPGVGEGKAFKPVYDNIRWRNKEDEFNKWCEGMTGYPIVDAGMRELNATGFMHNRVRMIVASFLCKHLLIDWRWGEAYFAEKLLDFDLASNNGGWQWASGSGCDAAPYFRIFNPYLQTEKFDKDLSYIKKWVPEYLELTYPKPLVEHEFARKRCLEVYTAAVSSPGFK
jgi:deoxyribodipyrimidine photo-lyase